MGGNVRLPIDHVVYVDAAEYLRLSESDKYSVARLIGRINAALKESSLMLMDPGRWGRHAFARCAGHLFRDQQCGGAVRVFVPGGRFYA